MTTYYLDLDRTLFRTEDTKAIFVQIGELYPKIDVMTGYRDRATYYVYPFTREGDTKTYYHDVSRWLEDNGLDPAAVYTRLQMSELADGRFEYPGTDTIVRQLSQLGRIAVLTFGEDRYQRCKAGLCPSLDGIPVITTLRPKGEYLTNYAQPGDWLIDDKVVTGLPEGVRMVRVDHQNGPTVLADCLHHINQNNIDK